MIKIGDIPNLAFVNPSPIKLITICPQNKTNLLKVIILWEDNKKNFIECSQDEAEHLVQEHKKFKEKKFRTVKRKKKSEEAAE